MEGRKLNTARVQAVQAMEQGLPWHEAAKRAGLAISQSTAYRLREAGEQGLREGRHGHSIKLRGEVPKFLEETCRQAPRTPSYADIQDRSLRGFQAEHTPTAIVIPNASCCSFRQHKPIKY